MSDNIDPPQSLWGKIMAVPSFLLIGVLCLATALFVGLGKLCGLVKRPAKG